MDYQLQHRRQKSIKIKRADNPSRKLYVFFGGILRGIGIPKFEFYKASGIVSDNKIFVRDFSQSWYHCGFPPESNDLATASQQLHHEIEKLGSEEVCFIGNSMGGFAAILFSRMLSIGNVIAFSPQTFISPILRWRHRDNRWKKQIRRTYLKSLFKCKSWDLKKVLMKSTHDGKISIFFSSASKLDSIHAAHLEGMPNVTTHNVEVSGYSGHKVVQFLRDRGMLSDIISGRYAN